MYIMQVYPANRCKVSTELNQIIIGRLRLTFDTIFSRIARSSTRFAGPSRDSCSVGNYAELLSTRSKRALHADAVTIAIAYPSLIAMADQNLYTSGEYSPLDH